MPNRLIRDGWLESEAITKLTCEGERFFLRLCLRADDFGRYHANPQLLRSNLFPLVASISIEQINRWLGECEAAGLIRLYAVDGKRCLLIQKFNQRKRANVSKFPPPSAGCQTDDRHVSAKRPADDGHVPDASQPDVGQPPGTGQQSAALGEGEGEGEGGGAGAGAGGGHADAGACADGMHASPPQKHEREQWPEAERPGWAEVRDHAGFIGLAEWKALDWFNEMEGCGWLDFNHRPVVAWRAVLARVKAKWEADGRPAGPPASKAGNAPKRVVADHSKGF